MLNFRKVLLAAAVAGLGLVGTASAQVPTCAATAGTTGYVAVEGASEQLPKLVFTCTNSNLFTGPLSLTLTGSVNFTNQLKTGSTSNRDITVVGQSGSAGAPAADPVAPATVTFVQSAPNAITINFSAVTATALAADTYTVTVTGLRVDPSSLPTTSAVTVTPSSSVVSITSASSWTAAFVTKSLNSLTANATGFVPLNMSTCGNSGTATTKNTAAGIALNVGVTGGYVDSLKKLADVTNSPAVAYGANGNAIAAVTGTVLAVTFNNLNAAGVNYYVPAVITGTNVVATAYTSYANAQAGVAATTVTNPSTLLTNIIGTAAVVGPPAVAATNWNLSYAGLTVPTDAVLLPVSGTSGTIYYGVTGNTATLTESLVISLAQNVPVIAAVTGYNTTPVTVSVSLAGATSPAYPQVSANQTAYTATPATTNATNGLLNSCSTTLLFPYVTNASGFDTGIAIANAATGTGAPASTGSCNLNFYGTGGANTSPYVYNTGNITAGTANATPIALSAVDAGLTGYAVAVCNFQGAHGYAFLFTAGGGGLAADYIAPILSSGGATTNYNGAAGSINPSF